MFGKDEIPLPAPRLSPPELSNSRPSMLSSISASSLEPSRLRTTDRPGAPRLDDMLRRVRTRMGRLSDDERFEVVHAVIRDVRVDNHGAVENHLLPPRRQKSLRRPLWLWF